MEGKKGKFIVLEGIDGCGKDTQIDLFKKYLEENNLQDKFYFTRLPGGTSDWTQKIRSLMHDMGVPDDQISVLGYGEEVSKFNNKTEEGKQKNRRVDFKVF